MSGRLGSKPVNLMFILSSDLANRSLRDKAWVIHLSRCFQLVWHYEPTILWSKNVVDLCVISPVTPSCFCLLLKLYTLKARLLKMLCSGRQGFTSELIFSHWDVGLH